MEESLPEWYRERRYLHFDRPVLAAKATEIVANPSEVSRHSFYPLIGYEVTKKKIRKDKTTGKVVSSLKNRPIRYAAHVDSHIYAYYAHLLSSKYETELARRELQDCVLAFRSLGKSNIEFAGQVFDDIRKMGTCGVVALDVSEFFDTIDHAVLKGSLEKLLNVHRLPTDYFAVFKAITQFSFVDKKVLFEKLGVSLSRPKRSGPRLCSPKQFRELVREGNLVDSNKKLFGIPQGTPISALLSNIYMLDFDEKIQKTVLEQGGKYYRYCDDIVVIAPLASRDTIEKIIQNEIKALNLTINAKKTERVSFQLIGANLTADKPLQYLGFTFDGERVLIRSAALARYSEHMKGGVKLAKATAKKVNQIRARRGLAPRPIFMRKLYTRYSHLGRRNFVTYGHRAAKILDSEAIKGQLKPLWKRLQSEISVA